MPGPRGGLSPIDRRPGRVSLGDEFGPPGRRVAHRTEVAVMAEHVESRRAFTRQALQSLTAVALLEGLAARHLFGADVRPVMDGWIKELNAISRDVRDHKVKDVEFTRSLEGLYRRVDLDALLKSLDFDRIAREVNYPAIGAREPAGRLRQGLGPADEPGLRPADLRDEEGPLGRPPRPRQHGHRLPRPQGQPPRPALRPGRGPQGPLHRPPDHRPELPPRRVLDGQRPQGQRPLVPQYIGTPAFIFNVHVTETDPENPKPAGAGLRRPGWARSWLAVSSRRRRFPTARSTGSMDD